MVVKSGKDKWQGCQMSNIDMVVKYDDDMVVKYDI